MLSCRQNFQQSSTKLDRLSNGFITPNLILAGSTTSETTNLGPVLALAITPVASYIKEELQRLLKICIGAKKLSY